MNLIELADDLVSTRFEIGLGGIIAHSNIDPAYDIGRRLTK